MNLSEKDEHHQRRLKEKLAELRARLADLKREAALLSALLDGLPDPKDGE
jgi:hypothetical protein